MADIVDAASRSRMMSRIGRKDTGPELAVRRYLHAAGLRYRLHGRNLPGRPDIVLPQYRSIVFVHGCFWHRHEDCPKATTPSSREQFWQSKFATNVARDRRVTLALQQMNWVVFTVWECEIKDPLKLDELFWKIVATPREPLTPSESRREGPL